MCLGTLRVYYIIALLWSCLIIWILYVLRMVICKPRHWDWNWYYKRHYFQFHGACQPQAWQGGNLGWQGPTHKVTWHFYILIVWQIKNVISPLSQGLWTPKLAGWWLGMRESHPQSHVIHRLRGHVANQRRYISTFTRYMDPKLSRVVT